MIRYVFTDRRGGVSAPPFSSFNLGAHVGDDPIAVAKNRELLRGDLAVDSVVWMEQVHSGTVRFIDDAPIGPVPATDGLVTRTPGLALAVLVADCIPVIAYDEAAGVIGVAHAGRLGAAAGIGTTLIQTMTDQGAEPGQITVLLGPAICGSCYEVPAAMQTTVEQQLPGSATTTSKGTPGLDLPAGMERQFRAAGVVTVHRDPRCTLEEDHLFSHRREAPTGRQTGVIWLP